MHNLLWALQFHTSNFHHLTLKLNASCLSSSWCIIFLFFCILFSVFLLSYFLVSFSIYFFSQFLSFYFILLFEIPFSCFCCLNFHFPSANQIKKWIKSVYFVIAFQRSVHSVLNFLFLFLFIFLVVQMLFFCFPFSYFTIWCDLIVIIL